MEMESESDVKANQSLDRCSARTLCGLAGSQHTS
jgi:hypothetical protein